MARSTPLPQTSARRWRLPRPLREPAVAITVLLIVATLLLFVLLPSYSMLIESVFTPEGEFTWARYQRFFGSSYFRNTLYNTLAVSSIATLLSMLLGFIFAYTVTRTNLPLRGFFSVVVLIPMLLPAFLIAFALILLFGRNGLINNGLFALGQALQLSNPAALQWIVYGADGVIVAQTLTFFPLAFLLFSAALSAVDARLEDAAEDLGASYWYTMRRVTLPLLAPAAFSSALLVFMFNASAFGAPAILGGGGLFFGNATMLAPEAIIQTLGASSDWGMGATIAVVLVIPSLFIYLFGEHYLKQRSYITVGGAPTAFRPRPIPPSVRALLFGICLLTSLFILSVLLVIFMGAFTQTWGVNYSPTWRHINTALNASRRSISNSVLLAASGALAAAFFGIVCGYIYQRKRFVGVRALDILSMLPYALPGMVMGLGFAITFSGRLGFLVLSGSWSILFLNHFIRRMPFAIRSSVSSLRQIDPVIEEAAADLGGRPLYSFGRVTLPLLKASFLGAFVFGFINMMTDITAVIFLVSPRWRLLAVDIFNAIDAARYGTAAALSVVMTLSSLLVLALTWLLSGGKLKVLRR